MTTCNTLERVAGRVDAAGLVVRGAFHCDPGEPVMLPDGRGAATLVLLGGAGRDGFQAFRRSPEWGTGGHPLDRFTERVVAEIAGELDAAALFPHQGPPWLPFQRWAARAEPVSRSPLGILIHPRHGLWHAYRAALAFARPLDGVHPPAPAASPCDACDGRPCLTACPVDAFSASGGYDVAACAAYLARPGGQRCLEHGCQARLACPAGAGERYGAEQMRFHMAAFARARGVDPGPD